MKSLLQNKQRVVNARVSDIYGRLEGRPGEGGEEIVWKLKLNVFPLPSQFFLCRLYGANCFDKILISPMTMPKVTLIGRSLTQTQAK